MDWASAKVLAEGGVHDESRSQHSHVRMASSIIHTVRSNDGSSHSMRDRSSARPRTWPPSRPKDSPTNWMNEPTRSGSAPSCARSSPGKPPYAAATAEEALDRASAAALDDVWAGLDACGADEAIVALAKRCLAAEPRDRPRDAGVVARRMRAHFDSMEEKRREVELQAAEARVRVQGERKARWVALAIAAIILTMIGVGAGCTLNSWTAAAPARLP